MPGEVEAIPGLLTETILSTVRPYLFGWLRSSHVPGRLDIILLNSSHHSLPKTFLEEDRPGCNRLLTGGASCCGTKESRERAACDSRRDGPLKVDMGSVESVFVGR